MSFEVEEQPGKSPPADPTGRRKHLISRAGAGFNLTVFGATGRTGKQVIRAGLEAELSITAYARHPEKLDDVVGRVRVVAGELHDEAALRRAVGGAAAVLSVLAPREESKSYVVTHGTELVVAAMHLESVRRLVVTAGAGVRQPGDSPKLMDHVMGWMVRLMAADVHEDMRRTVEVVQASRLDWMISFSRFI